MKKILLSGILCGIFISCEGQKNRQFGNDSHDKGDIIIGETVSEVAKDIWVIFQDKNNNYWFGSNKEGVYRYDGKTMRHFSVKDGLHSNIVREIKEDKAGNIFFNTLDGISKFDGQKFTALPVTASNNEWKSEPDDLWFTVNQEENGSYRYDGEALYHLEFPKHYLEDEFYKRLPNPPYNPYQVYTIYKDRKGDIWFGTSTFGVCRYDGKSLNWMYEKHLTQIEDNRSFGIRSIIEDKSGRFWFCNTKYRYTILPGDSTENGKSFIRYIKEKGIDNIKDPMGGDRIYFQTIAEDSNGDLWMQTYLEGIWRYDGKKLTHYPVKDGTENVNVISMYLDRRGSLWLGTQEKGPYKFNGKAFEQFEIR